MNGYVAHAPMEPHTAMADVKGDKATVWASTQSPFRVKDEVAQAAGFPPANVHVIMPFVGGGFGGKTRNIQAVQAARLAKIVGKPVQVAWTREDEFFNDSFRPAAVVKIRSGTDDGAKIVFWDYGVYFAGRTELRPVLRHPPPPDGFPRANGAAEAGPAPASVRRRGLAGARRATPTFSPARCQIDVMAAKAGMDPFEFRMKNLADERMKRVLQGGRRQIRLEAGDAPEPAGHGHRLLGL